MQALAILLIGFSLFSALSIALGHFHGKDYRAPVRAAGLLLLLILGGLQFMHYLYLQQGNDGVHGVIYRILLFSAAPTFYLFSRPVLLGSGDSNWRDLLHFLPVFGAVFLPFDLALPLSFLLGAGYLAWLARRVLALRQQRRQFQWELAMLGGIFLRDTGKTPQSAQTQTCKMTIPEANSPPE